MAKSEQLKLYTHFLATDQKERALEIDKIYNFSKKFPKAKKA